VKGINFTASGGDDNNGKRNKCHRDTTTFGL
jgi:hypothetical protein